MLTFTRKNDRSKEVRAIRRDLQHLKNDLHSLLNRPGNSSVKDRISEVSSQILLSTKELESLAQHKLQDAYGYVHDQGQSALTATRKEVTRRPLSSLTAAFGVGMVIGAVLRK